MVKAKVTALNGTTVNTLMHYLHNVPMWLADSLEGEKAVVVFNREYQFGGWQPLRSKGMIVDKDGNFKYPGDPVQKPLFKIEYNDEVIYGYESEMWAIVQKDGSFEISRMD